MLVLPLNQVSRQKGSPTSLDYISGLARRSSAHAPRLRRRSHRHRHRAGRRSAAHRSYCFAAPPALASRGSRLAAATQPALATCAHRQGRRTRLYVRQRVRQASPSPAPRRRGSRRVPRRRRCQFEEAGAIKESPPHPDLREVLAELARRDTLSVLLEAGAALNEAALAAGVVDKVRLFYAPMITSSAWPATL